MHKIWQMEKQLLITNGRVIDPASKTDTQMDLLVIGSKIAKIYESGQKESIDQMQPGNNLTVIDASGKIVVPGLIDCHVHFREPGFETKETLNSGCRAAINGGFTSVICEPNTCPPIDNIEMVDSLMEKTVKNTLAHLYTKACMTKGSLGKEMTDIVFLALNNSVLALSDDGNPVIDNDVVNLVFSKAKEVDITVTPHCEDSPQAIFQKKDKGIFTNPPYTNEAAYIERDIACAENTGVRLHISHISLKESVDIIRKAKRRKRTKITCEVTPHHLTMDNKFIDEDGQVPKVCPPLRSGEDVIALRQGLADGTIDVIASDHAPHTLKDKENGAFGLIGLETTLGVVITEIVKKGVLSWSEAIQKMTYNPSLIFGINSGQLLVGMPADITIIDPDLNWTVDPETFESKSRNCPFRNMQLQSKACTVIVDGTIVMMDGNLC